MNEMLNYVFKSMKTTERALAKLEKTMRMQVRSNRRLKLIAITGVAYALWAETVRREQQEEIERLSGEVEELKRTGE